MNKFAYCNETDLNRFLGLCRKHRYQVLHNQPNFLSAIFISLKNLLFRTPPRPFVRFSRKLNRVISRPCRLKVMNCTMIDKTVFVYHSIKFEACCQNDYLAFISAMPSHFDTKLCMCHCHLTLTTSHLFRNCATYCSKVITH